MEHIKQKMEAARKQREEMQATKAAIVAGMRYPPKIASGTGNFWLFLSVLVKDGWFLSGITVVFATVMVAWVLETDQGTTDSIIGAEQKITSPDSHKLPVIDEVAQALEPLPPPAAGQTRSEVRVTNAPRRTSTGEITQPQDATSIAAIVTEPSLVPKTDRVVPMETASPAQSTDTVEGRQPGTRESPGTSASVDKEGPWVINIASLSSKADADRLAEKARSRDVETEQQQVTVKGKQYWRVQITGFSTAAEARTNSDTVKEKLGLKDVWITTR